MEPIIIAALISLIAAESGALITLLRNKKNNNPGSLHEIHLELHDINNKLGNIEKKLDDALGRGR